MKRLLLISCLTLIGCANYVLPEEYSNNELSTVVESHYDKTWTAIIDHASSTFFAIDSYEKESGLITLSFGASEIEQFVDCGEYRFENLTTDFDGPYTEWVSGAGGTLEGRLNITARNQGDNETRVRVNARYVLTYPSISTNRIYNWTFDSGGSDSIRVTDFGSTNTITCVPTGSAEYSILESISNLSR